MNILPLKHRPHAEGNVLTLLVRPSWQHIDVYLWSYGISEPYMVIQIRNGGRARAQNTVFRIDKDGYEQIPETELPQGNLIEHNINSRWAGGAGLPFRDSLQAFHTNVVVPTINSPIPPGMNRTTLLHYWHWQDMEPCDMTTNHWGMGAVTDAQRIASRTAYEKHQEKNRDKMIRRVPENIARADAEELAELRARNAVKNLAEYEARERAAQNEADREREELAAERLQAFQEYMRELFGGTGLL